MPTEPPWPSPALIVGQEFALVLMSEDQIREYHGTDVDDSNVPEGCMLPDRSLIGVNEELPNSRKRTVLMHEIQHAICEVTGLSHIIDIMEAGDTETICAVTSSAWVAFWRDNPHVYAYIKETK